MRSSTPWGSAVPRSVPPRRRAGPVRRRQAAVLLVVSTLVATLLASVGVVTAPATQATAAAPGDPWMNTSLSPDRRARLLAAAMTLPQKVGLFNLNGDVTVPELGIPPRHEIDATNGVHQSQLPTTAMPAAISLAASRDRALAKRWGEQTSREVFDLGYNGNAAPTMDVVRSPYWGRMWETFGEDPVLSGLMGAAEIQGIQSVRGVYALVKHFGVYNQETGRGKLDNIVDERTLREIYLRNWKIAVRTARPGAVMCAFPRINGTFSCQSREVLTETLKKDWGFQGFVSTDFGAGHKWEMFEAGTDVAGAPWVGAALLQQVRNGTIPRSRFNFMVHRILRTMFARGLFERRAPGTTGSTIEPAEPLSEEQLDRGERIAEQAAVRGSVLLRNTGVLPLDDTTASVAVIGSGADEYITGTGSPQVPQAARLTTILDGIEARDGVEVTHVPGTDPVRLGDVLPGPAPVPSSVLRPASGEGTGLTGEYFDNPRLRGNPLTTRVDDQVNIRTGLAAVIETFDVHTRPEPGQVPFPLLVQPGSARWTGTLDPVVSGPYTLSLTHLGQATLWIDGEQVLSDPGATLDTQSYTVDLTAEESYDLRLEYAADAEEQCCANRQRPGPSVRLGWVPPTPAASPQVQDAVAAASEADVAVVVVRDDVGESTDRYTLALPQGQDLLVRAVAEANPRTVVVSATSGPVLMPWVSEVAAIVQSWYPGEAGGAGVASLLWGEQDFTGRLPVTFPRSEEQVTRVVPSANPTPAFSVVRPTVRYPERWRMGYRGYLAKGQRPLFAFGHGLSYASVGYRAIRARPVTLRRLGTAAATVTVRNTGERDAVVPVHVYVGRLPVKASTPVRQLAGVRLVTVPAGETVRAKVGLDRRALEYWRPGGAGRWVTPTGRLRVYTGPNAAEADRSDVLRIKRGRR